MAAVFVLAAFPVWAQANHTYDNYSKAAQAQVDVGFVPAFNFYDDAGVLTPFSPHPDATHAPLGAEILPDGQAEPTSCENTAYGVASPYGATAWYEFHPDVPGGARFEVQGEAASNTLFDAVITVMQFNPSTGAPLRSTRQCVDYANRNATEWTYFPVNAGQHWKIQIGGYTTSAGPFWDYHEYALTFYRDTDGDKVFDDVDACKTTPGDRADGCATPAARPDADGDGVYDDGPDKCLGENSRGRDNNNPANGCVDYVKLQPDSTLKWGTVFARARGRFVRNGVKVTGLLVKDIDQGTKVEVRCSSPRTCKKKTTAAGRRGRVEFDALVGKKLRPGQSVTLRVTGGALEIGKVISWQARPRGKKGVNKTTRCIDPKSKRVRPCKSVSTLR